MKTEKADWEELKSALRCRPSLVAFGAVCSIVETWPNQNTVEDALTFATRGLAAWPSSFRTYANKLLSSQALRRSLPLVRWLNFSHVDEAVAFFQASGQTQLTELHLCLSHNTGQLRTLDLQGNVPNLKHLHLDGLGPIGPNDLRVFLFDKCPGQLQSLTIADFPASAWAVFKDYLMSPHANSLRSLFLFGEPPGFVTRFLAQPPPQLESLLFSFQEQTLAAINQHDRLAKQLRSLDFSDQRIGSRLVVFLSKCKNLINLESLDFTGCEIEADGIAAIADAPFVDTLKSISLRLNQLHDVGCIGLWDSALRNLQSLTLSRTGCSDKTIKAIATRHTERPLNALDLSGNMITGKGLVTLLRSDLMNKVQTLRLANNQIANVPKGSSSIRSADQLITLDLAGNKITDDTVSTLLLASTTQLEFLNLGYNAVTDAGVTVLSSCSEVASLLELDLNGLALASAGIQALQASTFRKTLQCLKIGSKVLDDASVTELVADIHQWDQLRILELADATVADLGLSIIATSRLLSSLWSLTINSRRPIGDVGVEALASTPILNRLIELSIVSLNCSIESLKDLVFSPALSKLERLHVPSEYVEQLLQFEGLRPNLRAFLLNQISGSKGEF